MKKGIIIGLTLALMMTVGSLAIAKGPGNCGTGPGAMARMTPEQAQKFAQFQSDTLSLRQKMMQLRTELMVLRTQTKTDWKAVSEKEKEMVDLRIEIQKKASEAGVSGFGPGRRGGDCDNCGMGMGQRGGWRGRM
ncbi:MAG: hypothetical protein HGA78_10515 [Nitrospirales bacterium]|nr:hypothetical protein [Nitrospirales bacterium]